LTQTPKPKKALIDRAYLEGEKLGMAVWTEDEAGPYQTKPRAGTSWHPMGCPTRLPHEYIREGTAKLMTLFHPASGKVRVKGVPGTPNKVLHAWLQQQLEDILNRLPPDSGLPADREVWLQWQQGLKVRITLPKEPERLRMLLVMDNLAGHLTPSFVGWMFDHGIMPLYTPVGGSWLNLSESMQHILVQRALAGQDLRTPKEIINNLEQAARAWNKNPTPFTWGGRRHVRRQRARERMHRLAASGACVLRPLRRSRAALAQWQRAWRTTH
jgi:hypothetical protein